MQKNIFSFVLCSSNTMISKAISKIKTIENGTILHHKDHESLLETY